MGFFSKYNEKEKALLDLHIQLFQQMGIPESSTMAEDMLDDAIEEAKKVALPPNAGDKILEKEKTDENTRRVLEKKRREGVRDEDIRWWWNLDGIERIMMLKIDELHRLVLFRKLIEEDGKTDEESGAAVRKYQPVYGNPEDMTHTQGDDRPLPEELKDRINVYIEKQGIDNPDFKNKLDSFSSFNALVRKEIGDGNI